MAENHDQRAFLAEIASDYYHRANSVQDIASQRGLSEAEVKQLLERARSMGVVQVTINRPWQTNPELEAELKETFHLKQVRVLSAEATSSEQMLEGIGHLAADYLSEVLGAQDSIGISWGSALYQMIMAMPPMNLPDVEVVQLIGATGNEPVATDGPILARLLANRLNCGVRFLHAPLIVESETGRNALLQERTIRDTLARASKLSIALVGIGSTHPELYSLLRTGYVSPAEAEQIRLSGAVGDICAQHYNAQGEWLDLPINRRVIGITLDTLSRIPTVMGVAGGAEKARSILAALRKGYVNVLVTDEAAARAVLALHTTGLTQVSSSEIKTQATPPPLIAMRGIWKVFDGVPVLRGVNLNLLPGEIHALLGGNGSGKSTLMKILSGVYTAEAGSVEMNGSPIAIHGPSDAHAMGIYLVPQEPQIFPHLTVEENILLGAGLQQQEARSRIVELARDLGFEGDLSAEAGMLSIANQQLLEIIRGLLRNARVLIFDEPTSTLTFREVDSLFAIIRKLAEKGIGIFFISHRLNEILTLSERISVLRDGNLVLSAPTSTLTSRDLIRAMLPETSSNNGETGHEHPSATFGEVVLEISGLSGDAFQNLNLSVRAGEVVGLAGVVGAGRTELAHAILGLEHAARGTVMIAGQVADRRSPRRCAELGLVYLPEDRHAHGIFLELPNLYTTTASILPRLGKVLLSQSEEARIGARFVDQLRIKINSLSQQARTLSGGNQQKVVLSKCLAGDPKVVILDEPTRGVDAKARQDVYHLIRKLTEQGVGILLISSDLEEVIQLSDRVLVMYHGQIVEELPRAQCQIERITASAFGVRSGV
jgi:AI-2 transport system ATP-binding protein